MAGLGLGVAGFCEGVAGLGDGVGGFGEVVTDGDLVGAGEGVAVTG